MKITLLVITWGVKVNLGLFTPQIDPCAQLWSMDAFISHIPMILFGYIMKTCEVLKPQVKKFGSIVVTVTFTPKIVKSAQVWSCKKLKGINNSVLIR